MIVALSGLILGVHYFSWAIMMVTLIVYCLLFCRNDSYMRKIAVGSILPVLPALLLTRGVELAIGMVGSVLLNLNILNLLTLLSDWEKMYIYFGRGAFAAPIIYTLSFIGATQLNGEKQQLLKCWLTIVTLGIFIIPSDALWRLLFVLPFASLAAFGCRRIPMEAVSLIVLGEVGRALYALT